VPIKILKPHKLNQPWFTHEVSNAIKIRGKLHNRWRRNPTDHNWAEYRTARNRATLITNHAKRAYYESRLNSSLPPKTLWKNLKSVGVGNRKSKTCPVDADVLNKFFLSSLNSNTSRHSFTVNDNLVFNPESRFNFSMCTESDVFECFKAIQSNAIGEDGISLKFLKIIIAYIIGPLTHIINFSLTSRKFPKLWKVANIIPVEKKKNAAAPEHYRPISILSTLSKIFEKFIARQIVNHLKTHKLLTEYQSGFREKHSCTTAMLKIVEDIREKYDKGEITILVLLDFSKAFDSLNFETLLIKLEKYFGFDAFAVELMRSYLTERLQCVIINNNKSSFEPINSGVPQGSILGPILFSMFINDIVKCCHNVSIHLYADDAQIYLSRPIGLVEDLVVRINEDLSRISDWAKNNSLILNASKTQALPISHCSFDVNNVPEIILDNKTVQFELNVTSLGFKLNRRLDCSDHVNNTVSKIYATLRSLWATASYIPEATKLRIVRSLIIPIISYGAQVYGNLDSASKCKLQLALNNAARYIFNKRKYDHISNYAKEILNCDINSYFNKLNLIYLFKLIHSNVPEYLFAKLSFVQSTRTRNLVTPTFNYLVSSRTFFVSAVKLWNSLPNSTKQSPNLKLFKLAIDDLFC